MALHLGLDLGGTNIKAVVRNPSGDGTAMQTSTIDSLVYSTQIDTEANRGPDHVVDRMIELGRRCIAEAGDVACVGVAVPGLFDMDRGTTVFLPNLAGDWDGVPVVERLADGLGKPVAMINDGRSFVLAEATLGAAAGCDTVVGLVLGTGIGGGLVIGGRLHMGRHGRAAELGHQVIVPDGPLCGCGNRGCLESVATAAPFALQAGHPTPHDAVAAAIAGDWRAIAALDAIGDALGRAIANLVTALVPERVVIGGGIATAGDMLLSRIDEAARRHQRLVPDDWYDIVGATLGHLAGAVGASIWAGQRLG